MFFEKETKYEGKKETIEFILQVYEKNIHLFSKEASINISQLQQRYLNEKDLEEMGIPILQKK